MTTTLATMISISPREREARERDSGSLAIRDGSVEGALGE
jgi:hypothetical protein